MTFNINIKIEGLHNIKLQKILLLSSIFSYRSREGNTPIVYSELNSRGQTLCKRADRIN